MNSDVPASDRPDLRADALRRAASQRAAGRDWDGAAALLGEAADLVPGDAATLYAMARALQNGGHPRRSHAAALAAQAATPARWAHGLGIARLLRGWHETQALQALAVAMRPFASDAPPAEVVEFADMLVREDLHDDARWWLDATLARAPDFAPARYLRGSTRVFRGEMDAARDDLERAIALAPHYAQAHWRLAELRAGDPGGAPARVARMRARRDEVPSGSDEDIHFSFALHHELHDLGQHDAAWDALQRGARAKRATLQYDAAGDRALLAAIARAGDADFVAGPGHAGTEAEPVPLFIVGLFRSGTSLLERLLGGHPDIADAGESGGFYARLRLATDHAGRMSPGFLETARRADMAALGADFIATQGWRARGRRAWTEKLPSNLLLAGFIARALPRARFLHMRRAPMDVCFSNYRVLYGQVAAYSYDQQEMAGYHEAHAALTDHWRAAIGTRWLDIDHAALVADPETQMRRVLAHCGLPFDPAVLAPGDRGGIVSTASAAQVRDGLRRDAAPAWRPYRDRLRPMATALGVEIGD